MLVRALNPSVPNGTALSPTYSRRGLGHQPFGDSRYPARFARAVAASCIGRRFASRTVQERPSENPSGRCPNPRRCPTGVRDITFQPGLGSARRGLGGEALFRSAAFEQALPKAAPLVLDQRCWDEVNHASSRFPRRPFALARKPKRAKASAEVRRPRLARTGIDDSLPWLSGCGHGSRESRSAGMALRLKG